MSGGWRRKAYNLAALRELARRELPRAVFDFIDGGAEDELTRNANENAFAEWSFRPMPLNGVGAVDLSVELFGRRLALPVMIGPTGLAGMTWPKGELEAAKAARAAGTVYCMSHGSTVRIEDLAAAVPEGLWYQVFMYRDRGLTRSMAERAHEAGYEALVLTTDNQLLGQRERDLRNGFTIPPRLTWRNAFDGVRCLPWVRRMANARGLTFANYPGAGNDILSLGKHMAELLDPAASWRDVEWLRGIWQGPLILKGVLHPDEARRAIDCGVDGVIVSNHGGRQLDGAVASVRALPEVAAAAGGRLVVLLDGGIRRGGHVVKALALGADACLIGRPHLFGLAVAGADGVGRVLEILRDEMERVMALGGWARASELGRPILAGPGIPAAGDEPHPLRDAAE